MKTTNLNVMVMNKLISELEESLKDPTKLFNLDENQILNDEDLCRLLKVSVKTLRRYCKEGKLNYVKLGATYFYFKPDIYLTILNELYAKKKP